LRFAWFFLLTGWIIFRNQVVAMIAIVVISVR